MCDNNVCVQCGTLYNNNPINRIIIDVCGHYKCRMCLLNTDIYQCTQCDQNNKKQHNTVIQQNESSEKKDNKKKRKPKKFQTLPQHIQSIGTEDNIQYHCTICGSKFRHEKQLSYHEYCATEKPFACSHCPKKFARKCQLKHHLNVHAGIKKFICATCDASFYEKSKLITHTRIHIGKKDHKCSKCESIFYTSSALKEHEFIHLDTKPFSCKTCNAKFSNKSNLKKHEERHLNLTYHCPSCNKKCLTKYYLKKHSKVCNKTFDCDKCSKSFRTKEDRARHILTHSDVKKFQCKFCKILFKRKDNVRRHIRNTHSDVDLKTMTVSSIIATNNETILENNTENESIASSEDVNVELEKSEIEKPIKPLNKNDGLHSLDDWYRNIFIHKDHEQYIPITSFTPQQNDSTEINSKRTSEKSDNAERTIVYDNDVEIIINNKPYQNEIQSNSTEFSKVPSISNITKCNEANLQNYQSFSKRDIIEANEQRQSVIFNAHRTEKLKCNTMKANNQEDVSQKQYTNLTNVPIDLINSPEIESHQNTSPMNLTQSEKSNIVDTCMNAENTKSSESITNKPSEIAVEQDYSSKPVYLHKKVNYDQKPIHQQRRYTLNLVNQPKKLNNDSISNSEKKLLSKEELSELYKKILFSGYKGTSKPAETVTTSSNPSIKVTENTVVSNNEKSPVNSVGSVTTTPASTPEHWRRRLAHISENE